MLLHFLRNKFQNSVSWYYLCILDTNVSKKKKPSCNEISCHLVQPSHALRILWCNKNTANLLRHIHSYTLRCSACSQLKLTVAILVSLYETSSPASWNWSHSRGTLVDKHDYSVFPGSKEARQFADTKAWASPTFVAVCDTGIAPKLCKPTLFGQQWYHAWTSLIFTATSPGSQRFPWHLCRSWFCTMATSPCKSFSFGTLASCDTTYWQHRRPDL